MNALALATVDTFRNGVWHYDALTLLRSLPAGSVHCCVTSPPYYGLRDYTADGQLGLEDTPEQYVTRLVEIFEGVRRVLRDDGTCWVNLGDTYANDGKWGGSTGGLHPEELHGNTSIGRRKKHTGLKPKDLIGIPWRVAFALQAAGWWLRSDIIWHKPNPMPESVTDRPTVAHEYVFLLSKSARYWYDADAIRESWSLTTVKRVQSGPKQPIGTPGHKHTLVGNHSGKKPFTKYDIDNGRNRRTVWTVPTEPKPFAHFAMFPQALIEPMILAGCPAQVCSACGAGWVRVVEVTRRSTRPGNNTKGNEDRNDAGNPFRPERITNTLGFRPSCDCHAPPCPGVCLDPFMGSGTTGLVAQRLGRDFVGCDVNADYVELANRRIRYHGDDGRMVKEQAAGVEQLALWEVA